MDNVFIERLWRSLKCEDIYLRDSWILRAEAELSQGFDRLSHESGVVLGAGFPCMGSACVFNPRRRG